MFVTLQLNAINVAGDWATRSAGDSRTKTGSFGARERSVSTKMSDAVAIHLSELRGAVESIKRGAHSPSLADSRTDTSDVEFGAPALYHGMRFAVQAI